LYVKKREDGRWKRVEDFGREEIESLCLHTAGFLSACLGISGGAA